MLRHPCPCVRPSRLLGTRKLGVVVSDRQAAIEAAADAIYEAFRQGKIDKVGDAAEIALDALLAPRRVTCPTCLGRGRVKYEASGPVHTNSMTTQCPDCDDGTVPADPYLTFTSEISRYEQRGWLDTLGQWHPSRIHQECVPVFVRVDQAEEPPCIST